MKLYLLPAIFLLLLSLSSLAQNPAQNPGPAPDYSAVIRQRASKIVEKLGISDTARAARVTHVVAGQYLALSRVQETRDSSVRAAKSNTANEPTALAAQVKGYQDRATAEVVSLHAGYISRLQKELTPEQLDKVKDGMTFGVLPITYKAYHDMIPRLTSTQSAQIMTWLIEARELAMDAESSDKKHAMFGKYKGRINNYLSAAGYDLKKEGEEWQKRLEAAELTNK